MIGVRMFRKTSAVWVAILFSLLLSRTVEVEGQVGSPEWQESLSLFAAGLAEDVATDATGGITAGVILGRDLVWAQGFGWADVEERIPAGVNTIYRVGSISKSFTAVSLLQLWERGYLGLDDTVVSAVPELSDLTDRPAGARAITYRDLASHTAGLVREPGLEGSTDGALEFWEDKILESIPTTGFQTVPGERYSYSNIGFGILGFALGRVAAMPFMELVDGAIIRPLGMHQTGFVVTPAVAEQLATGYVRRRDGTVDSAVPYEEHVGRGYKVPNGGIYSTVGDLGRFVAGMTGAASVPVLGPKGRDLIAESQTPPDGPGYSFGFSVSRRDGGPDLIGHGGSVAGYNAALVFEPDSGLGVVLLRNYGGGSTNLGRAARELLWTLVDLGFRD